jgi:hypothetical protein
MAPNILLKARLDFSFIEKKVGLEVLVYMLQLKSILHLVRYYGIAEIALMFETKNLVNARKTILLPMSDGRDICKLVTRMGSL